MTWLESIFCFNPEHNSYDQMSAVLIGDFAGTKSYLMMIFMFLLPSMNVFKWWVYSFAETSISF